MESLSLKLDKSMLDNMDYMLKKNNYSTRTEFIRDAIRDKLNDLSRDELAREFLKFKGKAKKKTTYAQNRKVAEQAFDELAREMGLED